MKTKINSRLVAPFLICTIFFQFAGANLVYATEINKSQSPSEVMVDPVVVFEEKNLLTEESEQEDIQEETIDSEREFIDESKDERDFSNITKQTTDYTCGPASLATLINLMGGNADEMQLAVLSNTTEEDGTTLLELKNSAKKLGYETSLSVVSISRLKKLTLPVLFHEKSSEDFDHYAVIKEINSETVKIADSSAGNIEIDLEEFSKVFSGKVLSISLPKEIKSGQSADVALQILEEKGIENLVVDGRLVDIDDLQEELSDQEAGMTRGKFLQLIIIPVAEIGTVLIIGSAMTFTGYLSYMFSKGGKSKGSVESGIKTKAKRIAEHLDKIKKNPRSRDKKHWEGEIKELKKQISKDLEKARNKFKKNFNWNF